MISNYIDWVKLWEEEVDLSLDQKNFDLQKEVLEVIDQFLLDDDVDILVSECEYDPNEIVFCFSESGGKNESDNQGWSRDYIFRFTRDMELFDATYEQG